MFLFSLSKGDTWSTVVTQVSVERMHLRLVENTQLAWSRVWLLSCLNLAWISLMPDCYHISLTCDLARLCFSGPYETLGKYLWKQDTLHLSNFLFYIFGFVNGAERAYSQVGQTQRRSILRPMKARGCFLAMLKYLNKDYEPNNFKVIWWMSYIWTVKLNPLIWK